MNYNNSDYNRMRRDAVKRTHEMYNNSAQKAEKTTSEAHYAPKNNQSECSSSSDTPSNNNNPLTGLLSGIFSGNKIDNDKLIIILLIVILAKEGADLKLLIALGYIII